MIHMSTGAGKLHHVAAMADTAVFVSLMKETLMVMQAIGWNVTSPVRRVLLMRQKMSSGCMMTFRMPGWCGDSEDEPCREVLVDPRRLVNDRKEEKAEAVFAPAALARAEDEDAKVDQMRPQKSMTILRTLGACLMKKGGRMP